ncbi:helix-turn-helix domain-containing protein [Salipiger marinus]|uniref:helix-turn-helix domain-containing protein n=1 Tax=Salipiger marinus TaxID=555512 RepID=UPI004059F85D
MTLPRPPAHVAPYVEVLGHDLTVAFLLEFGGARLYWARDPKGRSEAEALIGPEKLRDLGRVWGGEVSRVPTARVWLAHALHAWGLPVNQIARRLHVTDVAVGKYLRRAPDNSSAPQPQRRGDDRQLSLF